MRKLVAFPVDLLTLPKGGLDTRFIEEIVTCSKDHWFVAVSNRSQPAWFDKLGATVAFCQAPPRENGKFVQKLLRLNEKKLGLQKSQVVILGYGDRDVPMSANSKSVLIRCDWRPDITPKIQKYGIPCPDIGSLPYILKLLSEEHPWYFTQLHPVFDTYCLTNAATKFGNDTELKQLAAQFQDCLKRGISKRQQDFITHALSSFYATEVFATANIWSYYPSSSSTNKGEEVIAEFAEIPRTTFGVHRKSNPLLIRHKPTASRHAGPQGGRSDPTSQIQSICLHPDYRGAIDGKTVVVLDDFMNYGVSFCVAAAFLRKAGAKKVLGVAMGKFPRSFVLHDIELASDPFTAVQKFRILSSTPETGVFAPAASEAFKRKFL